MKMNDDLWLIALLLSRWIYNPMHTNISICNAPQI